MFTEPQKYLTSPIAYHLLILEYAHLLYLKF